MTINSQHIPSITSGAFSGALFLLAIVTGLGFLFMFAAIIPLLMHGLSRSASHALLAACVACLVVALIGGLKLGVTFGLMFALPAWYLSVRSVQCRMIEQDGQPHVIWRYIGRIILDLSLYACTALAICASYLALFGEGIAALMQQEISTLLSRLPAEYKPLVDQWAGEMSFLFCAFMVWVWAISLYIHSWFANRMLAKRNKLKRASMAIEPFPMPDWVMFLLCVATLASFIGSPSMQFFGKTSFVILMLPYFFLGLALVHHQSKDWAGRGLLLFFLYFMLLGQVWIALFIAAGGLLHHIGQLNKRLSSPKN